MTLVEKKEHASSNLSNSLSTSFEEIYRTSYSHGLENIYALESIDIKTVRPIQKMKTEKESRAKTSRKEIADEDQTNNQLTLDFGDNYREWIEPFFLRESIEVLGLSQQAKKCLFNYHKYLIGDLVRQDLQEFVFLKGMGQGHIDEVKNKLDKYIDNPSIRRTYSLDFASWLRTLAVGIDDETVHHCFTFFRLEEVFSLSSAKRGQIVHKNHKDKQQLVEEGFKRFHAKEKAEQVNKDWKSLAGVFVIPWIRARNGLATKEELVERLQQVSSSDEEIGSYLSFFSYVYYNQSFPLADFLFRSEENVFCCDPHVGELYDRLVTKALTYFYQPSVSYSLLELTLWLLRDFARDWVDLSDAFVQLALRCSSKFRVRKGASGKLEVRLS
ncbi:MAG: DNA-directed RNA polymerase subunit alpha C-terminal domain-containing protein [Waddliaceae bacterium]